MNNKTTGEQLIRELLSDPAEFGKRGKAYLLLQHYLHGLSVDSLRPLLLHRSELVRRSAAYVVSELGEGARSVVREVVPLIHDPDLHTQWYALECVMVCSTETDVDLFVFVIQELENENDSMRRLAMRLVSNASQTQIEIGSKKCRTIGSSGALHE